MQDGDKATIKEILPLLEITAGRTLINSFRTGVEVSSAIVHGGPFTSTSDGRSTSVEISAIYRFCDLFVIKILVLIFYPIY